MIKMHRKIGCFKPTEQISVKRLHTSMKPLHTSFAVAPILPNFAQCFKTFY
nr:MAG TPA: hypothetical protein [Caudoviricetes sp.]